MEPRSRTSLLVFESIWWYSKLTKWAIFAVASENAAFCRIWCYCCVLLDNCAQRRQTWAEQIKQQRQSCLKCRRCSLLQLNRQALANWQHTFYSNSCTQSIVSVQLAGARFECVILHTKQAVQNKCFYGSCRAALRAIARARENLRVCVVLALSSRANHLETIVNHHLRRINHKSFEIKSSHSLCQTQYNV